ncbi:efflux RND transporter periplasmic adaptor subunit [Flavobacterium sp. LB3P122]|uniref:efflux RND transporter periplasmic adaptor subunit n=1 Tax=Flavobacterium algoriphilum TaxID=3398738 RepID=UPI003A8B4632
MKIKILQSTALFFAALFFLSSCNSNKKVEPVAEIEPKMETFSLAKAKLTTDLRLPAELSGFSQVDLFAKVTSYVKNLKVDIGSDVKQGQLLIELEAPEISSQLAAAESRLHSQEAIYTASNSTYQRLLETSKVEGTISKNDLELALSKKKSDYAQLAAARAGQREIKIMQNYLQIRAPFNGKVTARNVNTGAYVGQGAQVPLLTIQDQKKLRLSVSVPEAFTGYLKVGEVITFNVVSLRGETFQAKISRMSGALDLKLRSERVELDVINSDGKLLPGMVAEVLLPLNSKKETFVVPKSAVVNSAEGIFLIKVVNNKAQHIKISLGLEVDDQIEVFSDLLQQNDILLSKANEEIKEGATIN